MARDLRQVGLIFLRIVERSDWPGKALVFPRTLLPEVKRRAEFEQTGVYQDYSFNSPSAAAAVILGRSANGRTEWKDVQGKTLKQIQEK